MVNPYTYLSKKSIEDLKTAMNNAEPWEKWFAWYPVPVGQRRVWLKFVYRKKEWVNPLWFDGWHWVYNDNIFDILTTIK